MSQAPEFNPANLEQWTKAAAKSAPGGQVDALNWVTPSARHSGEDLELLRRRHATYARARQRRPQRWSRGIRDCSPAPAVTLNPRSKPTEAHASA